MGRSKLRPSKRKQQRLTARLCTFLNRTAPEISYLHRPEPHLCISKIYQPGTTFSSKIKQTRLTLFKLYENIPTKVELISSPSSPGKFPHVRTKKRYLRHDALTFIRMFGAPTDRNTLPSKSLGENATHRPANYILDTPARVCRETKHVYCVACIPLGPRRPRVHG